MRYWTSIAAAAATIPLATALLAGPVGATEQQRGAVAGISSLSTIACPMSTRCVALGTNSSGNGKSAVIDTANSSGTAWSGSVPTFYAEGLACAMPTTCVAVGLGHSARVTVANGAESIASTVPAPSGQLAAIDRIACPSASECFAVGFMGTEGHSKALVVHFSASGAFIAKTEEAGTSGIGDIACPTATECLMAVADLKNPERIQLLSNGHFGSSHPLAANTYVQALGCYKNVACFALAGRKSGSTERTNLLYELDPSTGAIMSEHTIGGGFTGDGIACPTATQCLVIGFQGIKPALVTATRGIPNAPRSIAWPLSAVACTDTNVCIGVGQDKTNGYAERL